MSGLYISAAFVGNGMAQAAPRSDFFSPVHPGIFLKIFIPENQNVCILKNLRYMPLLMHSHQFIEINYVLKSDHSLLIDPEKSTPLQDEDIIYVLQTFSTHFKRKIKTASLLISFCVSQHLILFSFIY